MNVIAHGFVDDDVANSAAPHDLRTGGGGGRIYPVDPAAVAHFKKCLAEQEAARPAWQRQQPTGIKGNGRLDADLQRRLNALRERAKARADARADAQEPKESAAVTTSKKMTDDELIRAHRRYVLSGLSLAAVAEDLAITGTPLRHQWQRLDLPMRDRGGRFTPAEIERIGQAHGLTPAEIVGNLENAQKAPAPQATDAPAANVRAQTSQLEPTVIWRDGAPFPFSAKAGQAAVMVAETAVAPAANGQGLALVNEQLAALQALLARAEARSVTISGKIRVELTAEVEI